MKPHKRAGAAIAITTSMPREQLAELCKQVLAAVSEKWLRVDKDLPEELIFGLRGPYKESSRQLQWRVQITEAAGTVSLRTKITAYEQERTLFFPATMRGWPRYEKWMHQLAAQVQVIDPAAQVSFVG